MVTDLSGSTKNTLRGISILLVVILHVQILPLIRRQTFLQNLGTGSFDLHECFSCDSRDEMTPIIPQSSCLGRLHVRVDAPEGSFALMGEGRVSQVRIRSGRSAPAERDTRHQGRVSARLIVTCHYRLFLPLIRLTNSTFYCKKVEDPQATRRRDAAGGEMDFAASYRGFDGAR